MRHQSGSTNVRLVMLAVGVLSGGLESQSWGADEIIQLPANTRMISYIETVASKDRVGTYRNKVFLAEDGRKRVEHLTAKHGLVSIFDDWGIQRLILRTEEKTASVWEEIEPFGRAGWKLQNWIEDLQKLCNAADKELGFKRLDGHNAVGILAKKNDRTFTIYVDANTGSPVRIGIDDPREYITLTEFEFHNKTNDPIFRFDAPETYTVVERHTKVEYEK